MRNTETTSSKLTKTRLSVSIRLPFLIITSFLLIIITVIVLVYFRFERRTVEEYTAMGKSATQLMANTFDADKIPLYLEKNFELEEYNDIREDLIRLKENYPDVMYMYVYHFIPEGGEVIFDLDSDYSLDADPPGTLYDPDPAVMEYMDDLCAGREIPVLTGDTEDGYMLTYMRPVFNSKGEYCCHVCVDFSMEDLHKQDILFVLGLFIALVVIMILIAILDIWYMRKNITGPIDRMKTATDKFSYEKESDHQENIKIMENLNIHTGDEIEVIYQLFIAFMKNNLKYMHNLSQAEDDIRTKDAQIGQISEEAYRDTLTGVGSKAAYNKKVKEINEAILDGQCDFAIVMVDMNDLKRINDVYGHKAGDMYIKGCCHLICETFKHSPVYRIGGDEFVAILQGQDLENRQSLVEGLKASLNKSYENEDPDPWLRYSAAVGIADYASDDNTFELVFKRADQAMYEDKKRFKEQHGSYR
ncbi:sensor domain-containing diguanylate cyclase [Ruminococcus albus]|uniref:Diguanylate cyclase (GGDEF) domain-containing protein n=1 Tax=Ruminococcus albus TaxID=1264 RepID=A0A1I1HPN6_RUMAL|nr:diguanylate cyclase [Ruminococcus albus]SFC25816.1 diguanylate cyclase (GGDEF) domain-containing protein [Ruminococcus albus]